jgi:hypothetical protein
MEEIEENAIRCDHCNAQLILSTLNTEMRVPFSIKKQSFHWLPVLSLILGLLCLVLLFRPSEWPQEIIYGPLLLASLALVLGIISIVKKTAGRVMAIAGMLLGFFSLLISFRGC